ncbi:hypothetical protein BGZ83_000247, partial [Gryganskiella cystojenkinii]
MACSFYFEVHILEEKRHEDIIDCQTNLHLDETLMFGGGFAEGFDGGPRVRGPNFFDVGVVGRRTGITMKENIKKDADGLDNIDDFWDDDPAERRRTLTFGGDSGTNGRNESDDDEDDDNYAHSGSHLSNVRQALGNGRHAANDLTPRREFLNQEASDALLSTPTSRRALHMPLSRGSSGSHVSDRVVDDYPSPSFQDVKRRLDFTNSDTDRDRYEEEDDEYTRPVISSSRLATTTKGQGASRKGATVTSSPALDKLLISSKQKSAQIQASTTISRSPLPPFKELQKPTSTSSSARSTTTTAATLISRNATTSNNRATGAGLHKAFDFGNYSADSNRGTAQDDSRLEFSDESGEERSATPPPRPNRTQEKAAASSKTPAEFKRRVPTTTTAAVPQQLPKQKPPPKARQPAPVQQFSDEDDDIFDGAYEEPERDEDRYQFSDEDSRRLSRRYPQDEAEEDEDEEEEEPLVRHSKKNTSATAVAPVQKKRTVSTEEPRTLARSKMTATAGTASRSRAKNESIPSKKQAQSSATAAASRKKATTRKSDSGSEEEQEDALESEENDGSANDRRVPVIKSNRSKNVQKRSNRSSRKSPATSSAHAGRRNVTVVMTEVPVVPEASPDEPGVRRSHRTRLAPLEFWRNEKVVLGPSDDLNVPVPSIKAVIRAAPEEPIRLGAKRRRTGAASSSGAATKRGKVGRSRREESSDEEEEEVVERELEKERRQLAIRGFVEDTTPKMMEIVDHKTDKVVKRVIATPKSQMAFKEVEGGQYQFHRGLEDPDSAMLSGIMKIKGGKEKPQSSIGIACTM